MQGSKARGSLGREIYSGIITLNVAFKEQIQLKDEIDKFNDSLGTKNLNKMEEKVLIYQNASRSKNLNGFESKKFPMGKQKKGYKISNSTQKQVIYLESY